MNFDELTEEQILKSRICDFALTIEGTWLEECIKELYHELDSKHIVFKPHCYLSDEWLTPDNEPIIGIPFYLAHPALIKIEKRMMYEAEGSTKASCMQLLRHETGHAINYAYGLFKKRKWKNIFGSMNAPYEDSYRFQAYSKNYVHHLEDFYAQCHPDEDFAETFAVWLTPSSHWETEYAQWGASEKLHYVDEIMKTVCVEPPYFPVGKKYWESKKMRMTLAHYYKMKKKHRAEDFPDFHDAYLREIFIELKEAMSNGNILYAEKFIRTYKKYLINVIAHMTDEKKYIIDELFRSIIKRCNELDLVLSSSVEITLMRITSYLTTIVMNKRYTGKYRGA
jgi:hypothetical protein